MRPVTSRWFLITASLIITFLPAKGLGSNCLIVWGEGLGVQEIPEVESAIGIAAGPGHGLVLKSDRTLARWGLKGTVSSIPVDATNVAAIAAGLEHCVAARLDGSVFCWGRKTEGQLNVPPGATNVVAVAAGENFNVALKGDGSLVSWGKWCIGGEWSQPFSGSLPGIRAVSAAENQFIVLRMDGTVGLYGDVEQSDREFAESLSNMVAVSAGPNFFLGLREDGSIVAWGPRVPAGRPAGNGFVGISAGGLDHGLAVGSNGVTAWGVINGVPTSVPVELRSGASVIGIAAGNTFCAAIVNSCRAPTPESIVIEPGTTVCPGTVVRLSQSVEGDTVSYQWLRNGSPVEGETGSGTVLADLNDGDVYACRVTSGCGLSATSGPVAFVVRAAPVAPDRNFYYPAGCSHRISVTELDGASSIHWVGPGSEGGRIAFGADFIDYTPAVGRGAGSSEWFSYRLSNGYCVGEGTISMVATNSDFEEVEIGATNGLVRVVFYGVPGEVYRVEKCGDVSFGTASTSTVLVTNAPEGGAFLYEEGMEEGAFFRVGR